MGQIPADTFRRLYLLYVLGQFPKGSYGLLRLHKITYISERDSKLRAFEFRRNHFGQYSDSLEDIKDQLVGMDLVGVEPLSTAKTLTMVVRGKTYSFQDGGNRLFLADRSRLPDYARLIDAIFPGTSKEIADSVREYLLLPQDELVRRCYEFPEFQGIEQGETIFNSNIAEYVDVQLSNDECSDLELALDPRAAPALVRLLEAVDTSEFDLDRVGAFDLQTFAS